MPQRLTETTPLSEAGTTTSTGRMPVQAISAGLGSSGYYSPEVLERAARDRLITRGTPVHLDHASESERHDRPERSVQTIAGVFTGDATYDPDRAALVGEVQFFTPWRERIAEMAPYIGLSISGSATDVTEGEHDGHRVKVIEGLAVIDSVDLVTRAGRGGQFLGLAESAGPDSALIEHITAAYGPALTEAGLSLAPTNVPATRPDSSNPTTEESQEDTMGKIQIEESEHQALTEKAGRVDTLESERAAEKARADAAEQKLAEATAAAAGKDRPRSPRDIMEARDREKDLRIAVLEAKDAARNIVNEELSNAWLPPSTVARLSTELMSDLPMVEGKLDDQALRDRVVEKRDQHELEAAEALEAAGVGIPRGLGAQRAESVGDVTKYTDSITESVTSAFGLSEAEAKTAAKGR